MADRPILFVAGLGRCGSSLAMQMLAAAGVPCAGQAPAYEPDEMNGAHGGPPPEWLDAHAGHAIKWLDPHRTRIAPPAAGGPAGIVLWLTRDSKQQARSQVKLISAFLPSARASRRDIRRMAAGISIEERQCWTTLSVRNVKLMRFEDLIATPRNAALHICRWAQPFFPELEPFDTPKRMAEVVRPRGPECQPDLSIEVALMEESDAQRRESAGANGRGPSPV